MYNKIEKIAVIGKGKMGSDIFYHLLSYNFSLSWICRSKDDVSVLTNDVQKKLKKMLRLETITQEQHDNALKNLCISTELSYLKDCDLIIETIIEDMNEKQKIFNELTNIVRDNCILATNTSSIHLKEVFKNCTNKKRCFGLHFFYPIKFIQTVEINLMKESDEEIAGILKDLVLNVGKKPLILQEEANFILNKIYTVLLGDVYNIYEDRFLGMKELEDYFKTTFFPFGLFNIVNSTGTKIIVTSISNYMTDRYRAHFTPLYNKSVLLMNNNYLGGASGKGIIEYEVEHEVGCDFNKVDDIDLYKQDLLFRVIALLYNEMSYIIQQGWASKDDINYAIQDLFGLSESILAVASKFGHEKITKKLTECYNIKKYEVFKPINISLID